MPAVTPTEATSVSATWIGVDGFSNSDLIQTGTEQVGEGGGTGYEAWYEILPNFAVAIGTVNAGDEVEAEVSAVTSGTWQITFVDVTQSEEFQQNFAYDGPATSAEWIEEDPTNGSTGDLYPFNDYDQVTFSDMAIGATDVNAQSLTSVFLFDSSDQIVSAPSNVVDNSFTAYYGPTALITNSSLPAGSIETAYSATLSASGGDTPYSYSIASASPPSWLDLNASTGALSGTPPSSGAWNVTFEVTDARDISTPATYQVAVINDPGIYQPLTPVRICDTRPHNPSDLSGANAQCNGPSNAGKTLSAGGTITVDVAGSFGVPASDVTAVVLNVTEADATASGYFTLYPTGSSQPTASDLNFAAGHTVPNLVEVGLGTGGAVSLYSAAHADAIVDLQGYVTTTSDGGAGLYNALSSPARICDTRGGNPSGLSGGALQCNTNTASGSPDNLIGPNNPLTINATGVGGVPASGAEAVVLNVTAARSTGAGYITGYPTGSDVERLVK